MGERRANDLAPAKEEESPMQAQPTRPKRKPKTPTGIIRRHSRECRAYGDPDAKCNCQPSYRAWVYSKRDKQKIFKTFSGDEAFKEAKAWRADSTSQVNHGGLRASTTKTVREAADEWLAGVKADPPTVLNRNGRPFKPSVVRGYEADLNRYVLPEIGAHRLREIDRHEAQKLVEQLGGQGLSGSKVRNAIMPARVIFRRARRSGAIVINPFEDLELPAAGGRRRDQKAKPEKVILDLLPALAEVDQTLYATAYLAGLRRGELRALKWESVELPKGESYGVIDVQHGWDDLEGEIETKSIASRRRVPFGALLRRQLLTHQVSTGRRSGFVFGRTASAPFTPTHIRKRAMRAWASTFKCGCKVDPEAETVLDAEGVRVCPEHRVRQLQPIGLHECRHGYTSWLFDARFTREEVKDLLGHGTADVTERYRHPVEGQEKALAARMDEYLARRTGALEAQLDEASDPAT
jgi:integrase